MKKAHAQVLSFITEMGMLKQTPRTGWQVLGVRHPETVAEHSFRCAVIGYCLSQMEKAAAGTAYQVLLMTLFNDMHESRIGDLHKMAQRYFPFEAGENAAFYEQTASLPVPMRKQLEDLRRRYLCQKDQAALIARDADILECLIQAKEYHEHGVRGAVKFMKKAPRFLRTKSARALWRLARETELNVWWERLSTFKR